MLSMKRLARDILVAILGLAAVSPAAAQQIARVGDGDVFLDHRIDRLLRTGAYVAITRDTTIGPEEVVEASLLVLDARLYLEGQVTGDLVGVDADLFVRPTAAVEGDVVNIGGGLYPSELARIEGRVLDARLMPYRVRRAGDRIVIVSADYRSPLALDGAFGFHRPEYNRVDGVALDWGASYRLLTPIAGFTPGVHGQVGYRTGRGAVAGGGSAFLERGRWTVEGGWMRDTWSSDRWIRGDLRNSIDFTVDGDDMRNYYGGDVAFGELRRLVGDEERQRFAIVGVRYQHETARNLEAGSPWVVFEPDAFRSNPEIDRGVIQSAIPFADIEWLTPRTALDARIELEQGWSDLAPPTGCGVAGSAACPPPDGSFTRLRIDSEFAIQALRDHTLEIETQLFLPLGGDEPLPRQRWGMMGGSGTLRTLADASLVGDHLVYSETEYVIPFRRIRLRMLGSPELQLLHLAGLAWTGERADGEDFVQNVGVRLQLSAFFARWLTDPASGDSELTLGVSWPFDEGYPWQQ